MFNTYKTRELFTYLGVTRDTLRFYEKKGLLSPKKDSDNNYRSYDIYDVYRIMIIDFYKKRGLSIQQIQDVLKDKDNLNIEEILSDKILELERNIFEQKCMLNRISQTLDFQQDIDNYLNKFTIKSIPTYRIRDQISDFVSVEEYENVLKFNSREDMFSKIMRHISFDDDGVIESNIYIIEPSIDCIENKNHIDSKMCLYTIIEETVSKNKENVKDILDDMYSKTKKYANENGFKLLNEAFAIIRFVTCERESIHSYIEVFVPFKN